LERIGLTCVAGLQELIVSQKFDNEELFAKLMPDEVTDLCKLLQLAESKPSVMMAFEVNLKLFCYYCNYRRRASVPITNWNDVTPEAIESVRTLRDFETAYLKQ